MASDNSEIDLEAELTGWGNLYNFARPHGDFNAKTPYEALKEKALATQPQNFFIAGEQQILRLTSRGRLEERGSAQIVNTALTLAASSSNGCHPKTINTKVLIANPKIIVKPILPSTITTMFLTDSARLFSTIFSFLFHFFLTLFV